MKAPTISVVLPVYNASKYLLEALESISNQTFKDWELIAINDGSTDNSLKILTDYAKKEPRLKILSRENKGIAKTLNEGIKLARGNWIARMDADDICFPERFEEQLKCLKDTSADICGTWYEMFDGNQTRISKFPINHDEVAFCTLFSTPMAHPTVTGKRKVFLEFLYDETLDCAQDYDLWCRMLSNNIKITNVAKVLLKYRVSTSQMTHKKADLQRKTAEKTAILYLEKTPYKKHLKSLLSYRRIFRTSFKKAYLGIIELNDLAESMPSITAHIRKYQNNLLLSISTYGLRKTLQALKLRKDLSHKGKLIYILLALLKIEHFKCYIYESPILKNYAIIFAGLLNKTR